MLIDRVAGANQDREKTVIKLAGIKRLKLWNFYTYSLHYIENLYLFAFC